MFKRIIMLFTLFFSATAYSQDFNLQLENKYDSVYESLSGVVVVSDSDCNVKDYEPVTLHYFDNPADSNYDSQSFDNFTYTIQDPVIVIHEECPEEVGSCVEEPFFEPFIDYQDVVKICKVYGVARLRDTGQTVIENNNAVFDMTSERLYLYQVKIYEHFKDTGESFSFVQMHIVDGKFELEEVQN